MCGCPGGVDDGEAVMDGKKRKDQKKREQTDGIKGRIQARVTRRKRKERKKK